MAIGTLVHRINSRTQTGRLQMEIDIIFPNHDAPYDGIGDYSRRMARALQDNGHNVRMVGAHPSKNFDGQHCAIGWEEDLRDTSLLIKTVGDRDADLIIVQFEQFSYGYRGWNPAFAKFLGDLRLRGLRGESLLVVHETYPLRDSLGHAVMHTYQKAQIRRLVRDADHVAFSCEMNASRLERYAKHSIIAPVPSSIAPVAITRPEARALYGFAHGEVVALIFGSISYLWGLSAVVEALARNPLLRVVYVGKDSSLIRQIIETDRLLDLGALPESEVSRVMTACDIGLVLPKDGLTARRSSFAAMALHGLAIIANQSNQTDKYLQGASLDGQFILVEKHSEVVAAIGYLVQDSDGRNRMRESILASNLGGTAQGNADRLLRFATTDLGGPVEMR